MLGVVWAAFAVSLAVGIAVTLPSPLEGFKAASLAGDSHCADFPEVRAALHVVMTVKITLAVMLSRIPCPTSPCTARYI